MSKSSNQVLTKNLAGVNKSAVFNMKNKELARIGECVLPFRSVCRIQLQYNLTTTEVELLQRLTFTDVGDVPLLLPVPIGTPKMTSRLGLIETGLFDFIIGTIIWERDYGKLSDELVTSVNNAHSMLKKFLGNDYSLIAFEPK